MRGVPEEVTEEAGVTITLDDGDELECKITESFDLLQYTPESLLTEAMRYHLHNWRGQQATIVCAYPRMPSTLLNEIHLVYTGEDEPSLADAAINDAGGSRRTRDLPVEALAFGTDVEILLGAARARINVEVELSVDEPAIEAIPKLKETLSDDRLDTIRLDPNNNPRSPEEDIVIVPCYAIFEYREMPWKSCEGLVQDAADRIPDEDFLTVKGGSLIP